MKTILRILFLIILIPVLTLAGLLVWATVSDYQPEDVEVISENTSAKAISDSTFNLMIWNIGYAGLGDDMDFFYDGGKMVRTSEERVKENLLKINNIVAENDTLDFFLFQEIDRDSKRSYNTDQLDSIAKTLNGFSSYYAHNYKVGFVPQPFSDPYGKVVAGLASFSRAEAKKTERYSFFGNYDWPIGVFMLDRCFMVKYYPLSSGKDLVIINTHNSAYDDGSLKAKQNKQLKSFLKEQQDKGNYVIVGGDWNQLPPNYKPTFKNIEKVSWNAVQMKENYMEGWDFAFDNTSPTNRELITPYKDGETHKKVIDFFLVSPNIEITNVKGIDLNFKHSDHNPVILSVKLR